MIKNDDCRTSIKPRRGQGNRIHCQIICCGKSSQGTCSKNKRGVNMNKKKNKKKNKKVIPKDIPIVWVNIV